MTNNLLKTVVCLVTLAVVTAMHNTGCMERNPVHNLNNINNQNTNNMNRQNTNNINNDNRIMIIRRDNRNILVRYPNNILGEVLEGEDEHTAYRRLQLQQQLNIDNDQYIKLVALLDNDRNAQDMKILKEMETVLHNAKFLDNNNTQSVKQFIPSFIYIERMVHDTAGFLRKVDDADKFVTSKMTKLKETFENKQQQIKQLEKQIEQLKIDKTMIKNITSNFVKFKELKKEVDHHHYGAYRVLKEKCNQFYRSMHEKDRKFYDTQLQKKRNDNIFLDEDNIQDNW